MRFRPLLAAAVVLAAAAFALPGSANANQRVVGGTRVSTGDYPYAVYLTTTDGFQFCGGTLVGPRKVVTAAHCATGQHASGVRVVVGRDDKESSTGVVVRVSRIWVDPNYRDVRSGADVAVFTLGSRVDYQPARVATDPRVYRAGTLSTVLGWGRTGEGGTSSRYLLGATVPVISDSDCARDYPQMFSSTSMVCAGYPDGGVDTCQGDSGGPMIIAGTLVGIASWGDGCARPGKPGVYTRVTAYAALINSV